MVQAAAGGRASLDLGENYAQELVGKAEVAGRAGGACAGTSSGGSSATRCGSWRPVVPCGSPSTGRRSPAEIARRAPGAAVLVQVNVSGAEQQGGCPPERVAAVVDGLHATSASRCAG